MTVDELENALAAMGAPQPRSTARLVAEIAPETMSGGHTLWRRSWGPVTVVRFTRGFVVQLRVRW